MSGSIKTLNASTGAEAVDNSPAPSAVMAIDLYSANTNNKSASISYGPDVSISHSAGSGTAVHYFEYKVINSSDQDVTAWVNAGSAKNFRASGLNLTNGQTYRIQVRAVGKNGNASAGLTSSSWVVEQVPGDPYVGMGLAATNSLSDQTLTNPTVNNLTRAAPLQANNLSLSGLTTWNTAGHAAIFLRAENLSVSPGAVIDASGVAATNANGGKGGSGGGGGGGNSSGYLGGTGGTGNAGLAGAGPSAGLGGGGGATTYASGFSYGNGGNASASVWSASTAGAAFNGAGGGGAGGDGFVGGGGGGGGGLIVITAETIQGTALLRSTGGAGFKSPGGGIYQQGSDGGGGVIWLALSSYNGNFGVDVRGGAMGTVLSPILGASGSSRIFQKNPDGSLTERRFTDSWGYNTVAGQTQQPLPFPVQVLPDVLTLSDSTLTTTTINSTSHSRVNPYSAKNLTINGTVSWNTAGPTVLFLQVNNLIMTSGSVLDASGLTPTGTIGGSGGSGGGGTSNSTGTGGGSGGSAGGHGALPTANIAAGGIGTASIYNAGFTYGTGGNGGSGANDSPGAPGTGGNGAGGGGSGSQGPNAGGGSGGGGGGLIVVVANSITGTGTVRAKGGNGSTGTVSRDGGGGGGGVVWIATKSYTGGLTADVSGGAAGGSLATAGQAGTARIFQILNDGSLLQRTFAESW